MTVKTKALPLLKQSLMAKATWAKDELRLPRPTLYKAMKPSDFLSDSLKYARGANSRGEWLYRENYLKPWLVKLAGKEAIAEDAVGNLIVQIGEQPYSVLHVGHIDTVHSDDCSPYQEIVKVKEVKGEMIRLKPWVKQSVPQLMEAKRWESGVEVPYHYPSYTTPVEPRRSLGADDACAVAIMLYMIQEKITGTYVFTRAEEHGCIGTKYMLEQMPDFFKKFPMAIEIDRKGKEDIVYQMSPGDTASKGFATELGKALGMSHKPSNLGTITDVGHMAKYIPECVNVAAGYWQQHSSNEHCDPAYLDELGSKMILVDWTALTTVRKADAYHKPKAKKTYGNYTGYETLARNHWNDYSSADLESEEKFVDEFANDFSRKTFTRENQNLLVALLRQLDMTIAELDDLATYGIAEPVEIAYLTDEGFEGLLEELEIEDGNSVASDDSIDELEQELLSLTEPLK